MADKKISALDSANPLQAADQFVVAQSGSTKQVGLTGLINGVLDGVINPDGVATGNGVTAGAVNSALDSLRNGTLTFPQAAASATPVVAMRFGNSNFSTGGLEVRVISLERTIGSADTDHITGLTQPDGSVLLAAFMNITEEVDIVTAAKVGLDYTGGSDPDQFGLTDGLEATHRSAFLVDPSNWTKLSGATGLSFFACATDGTAAGTIATGSIHTTVVYLVATTMEA